MDTNWLGLSHLSGTPVLTQYASSTLTVLLMLLRTQPIAAQSTVEMTFVFVTVLVGLLLQAVVIAQVVCIAVARFRGALLHKQRQAEMRKRLKYNHLPRTLQHRVTAYFEQLWSRHRYVPSTRSAPRLAAVVPVPDLYTCTSWGLWQVAGQW